MVYLDLLTKDFFLHTCDFFVQDPLCSIAMFPDAIGADRQISVGRPDFIEIRFHFIQLFQAVDIILHIPVFSEHENVTVRLKGIPADQNPAADVEYRDASGCVAGKMNDPQLSVPQIYFISVFHRNQAVAFSGASVTRFVSRMHIKGFKLFITSGMISVRMGIQEKNGQTGACFCDFPGVANRHTGIDQKRFFGSLQKEKANRAILNSPGILIYLHDLSAVLFAASAADACMDRDDSRIFQRYKSMAEAISAQMIP